MVAAVTSVSAIAAAPPATAELVLQPGTVVDAKVVQLLQNDLVQVALQGVLIDALSEVPLQAGQSLKLAVSETPQGVRLSVVPPAADGLPTPSTQASIAPFAAPVTASAAPRAPADTKTPPVIAAVEAQAIAVAAQTAVTRQGGLSQLFANLAVAAQSETLPEAVQQIAAQVIATQPVLDGSISGPRLQQAVAESGIFREALQTQSLRQTQTTTAPPDLKSVLIVLRQVLSAALGEVQDALPSVTPQPQAAPPPAGSSARSVTPVIVSSDATTVQLETADALASPRSQAEPSLPANITQPNVRPTAPPFNAGSVNALTELTENVLAQLGAAAHNPPNTNPPRTVEAQIEFARTNVPPPPLRGAAPSAQSILPASLALDTPPAVAVKQLLSETDGAIARQTLLQIASLPDRADGSRTTIDGAQPRWAFEIPFATPQGTAVAQFEIAQENGGGNNEVASAKRVWRARFSLDVEPAGPVHAIVSLAGETTSVRIWAERPVTAARLRAGATELAQAMQNAALRPGDIVIGEGAPPQTAAAPAGRFIDRAS